MLIYHDARTPILLEIRPKNQCMYTATQDQSIRMLCSTAINISTILYFKNFVRHLFPFCKKSIKVTSLWFCTLKEVNKPQFYPY